MNTYKKTGFINSYSQYLYIFIYFVVNLLTLTIYPFVHSDEAWLAGLSLEYLRKKTIFVTEPFFDLMPRQPHSIKSLFHILQDLFISVFGYSIFSVRLLSLGASLLVLLLFFRYAVRFSVKLTALLALVLFSLNIQFIYASHFARQENLLLLVLIAGYVLYTSNLSFKKKGIIIPVLIGLSIGFHPNSFIICIMLGFIYIKDVVKGLVRLKYFFLYICYVFIFALSYVGISLIGNPHFFQDYLNYGSTLSVNAPIVTRFSNYYSFYIKLYDQISGTYYLPNLKVFFIISTILIIIGCLLLIVSSKNKINLQCFKAVSYNEIQNALLMIVGFNTSLFIIGRFNPTSILFLILPIYILGYNIILIFESVKVLKSITLAKLLLILLIVLSIFSLNKEIFKFNNKDYDEYICEIKNSLPENAIVLGNLSSGFAFKDIPFYDTRNLNYLGDMTLEDYIIKNKINTIIYYEEYDYIHRNPKWQILYGDDSHYYDDLKELLGKDGTLVNQFENKTYGNRIVPYIGDYPWKISVYTLNVQ